jgi:carbon storage regulator
MLVLSRKIGESLVIGDNVKLTILEVGGQVKIGIAAPREISVHREEVFKRINATSHGTPVLKTVNGQ